MGGMTEHLGVATTGGVRVLTLRWPERQNLLTAALCRSLEEQFEAAGADTDVRVLRLDAEGPVFCAGFDYAETDAREPRRRLFSVGHHLTKPMVAVVQGPALGAGLGLLLLAHVVVAAQGITAGVTDLRHGHWPHGYWHELVRAFGQRKARELSLTARVMAAPEAVAHGIVHQIASPAELEERAHALCAQLAAYPPDEVHDGLRG